MKKKTFMITAVLLALFVIAGAVSITAMAASNKAAALTESTNTADSNAGHKAKYGDQKHAKGVRVNVISVAASILGTTEDEVKEAIKDGKVGDLLLAADKLESFKTAYLAEAKAKLEAAVAAETLTQTEADEKYAAEKTKMDAYDGTSHLCGGKDHSKFGNKHGDKFFDNNATA